MHVIGETDSTRKAVPLEINCIRVKAKGFLLNNNFNKAIFLYVNYLINQLVTD